MTIYQNYYAFFAIEGGVSTSKPMKYGNSEMAKRAVRKEVLVHLPEGGNAIWSVHDALGKAVKAGGWTNGKQFRVSEEKLYIYDKPEIE